MKLSESDRREDGAYEAEASYVTAKKKKKCS